MNKTGTLSFGCAQRRMKASGGIGENKRRPAVKPQPAGRADTSAPGAITSAIRKIYRSRM